MLDSELWQSTFIFKVTVRLSILAEVIFLENYIAKIEGLVCRLLGGLIKLPQLDVLQVIRAPR